jgi:hypothetical protein
MLTLWGNKKLNGILVARFEHPRRMYRNMKRAWMRDRAGYASTVAMGQAK